MNKENKIRLTVTMDPFLAKSVKEICKKRHLTVSGVIENFLQFFVNPKLYCFNCGIQFKADRAEVCPKCTWMICPHCNVCGCNLDDETVKAMFHMRRVYEDLLMGRVQ